MATNLCYIEFQYLYVYSISYSNTINMYYIYGIAVADWQVQLIIYL